MAEISVITLNHYPIFSQLQLEEALLRTDSGNWCLINFGTPPAIVMGISGNAEKMIDLQKWQLNPVPIIKRFSGGGTVFVDENTIFVTLICNTSCTQVPCFPEPVMEWNGSLYRDLFRDLPFELKENDYTIRNQKFGGNAQYLTKSRWLHHSTLLWDYKEESMQYLLMPQKTPKYRMQRDHRHFLSKLKDQIDKPETILEHLTKSLHKFFTLNNLDIKRAEEALHRPHRKSTQKVLLRGS